MSHLFTDLSITDLINIVLCVLSFLLAMLSIIFVILTLRQNNRILENSARPYITIYFDATQFGSPTGYFVVRNFGNLLGTITSCVFSDNVREFDSKFANISALLDCLNGMTIAPGQKYLIPFKLHEFCVDIVNFDLTYNCGKRTYTEHVEVPVENYRKYVKPRAANENVLKDVSYAAQEIAERLM